MDYAAPSAPVTYYDRSTGLMVFGILTVGLGILAMGLAALTIGSQVLITTMHQSGEEPPPIGAVVSGLLLYVCVGIGLVWTGIGSCLARRWACALLKIFSWAWLIIGITAFAIAAVVLPMVIHSVLATADPQGRAAAGGVAGDIAMVFVFGFYGIFLVILPAIWTWFYSSRHVKITCEARDPVVRWTDRCRCRFSRSAFGRYLPCLSCSCRRWPAWRSCRSSASCSVALSAECSSHCSPRFGQLRVC